MKDRIIRTAMQLFARQGYAGTSMREIAEATNVTKASLYYHFPDKETLYRRAMTDTMHMLCQRMGDAAAGVDHPVDRLRALVHRHLELFVEESDLIRALYHNLLTPDSGYEVDHDEWSDTPPLLSALEDCVATGLLDAERVADVFILLNGGIEYVGVNHLLHGPGPRPDAALGDRLIRCALPELVDELDRELPPRLPPRSASPADVSPGRSGRRTGRHRRRRRGVRAAITMAAVAASVIQAEAEPVVAIPGSSDVLDLDTCVRAALAGNPDLAAERAGLGSVRGQIYQAVALGLPSLDLVGNWSRSRDPSFALDETFASGNDEAIDPPDIGDADFDTFMDDFFAGFSSFGVPAPEDIPAQSFWRATADVTWDLNPFLVANAVSAARAGVHRQDALIQGAEHRTVTAAMTAYVGILEAAEIVAALDAELAARREFLDISRRRFELDVATALDTLQAAVSLANLEPERRRADQHLRDAGAELNVTLGRDPLVPISVSSEVELERGSLDPEVVTALALRRPDVRALQLEERLHRTNKRATRAEHLPYLSMFGSWGYVAKEFDELGTDGQDAWRASVSLQIPLFDGFVTRGRLKEAEADIQQTIFRREDTERRARMEALSLLGELDAARANLRAAELNMTRAEDALRITTLRYENSKADYLAVLNAQSDRFRARQNLIQARYEVLTGTAGLKEAIGISPLEPLETARSRYQTLSQTRSQ
jgi:outer membrane protein TolC